jgi:hypothetical protein
MHNDMTAIQYKILWLDTISSLLDIQKSLDPVRFAAETTVFDAPPMVLPPRSRRTQTDPMVVVPVISC